MDEASHLLARHKEDGGSVGAGGDEGGVIEHESARTISGWERRRGKEGIDRTPW